MLLVAVFVLACLASLHGADMPITIKQEWNGGFTGVFNVAPDHNYHGWCAHIVFDRPLNTIEIWKAKLVKTCNGNKEFLAQNMDFDVDLTSGSSMEVALVGRMHNGAQTPNGHVVLSQSCGVCGSSEHSGGSSGTKPITDSPVSHTSGSRVTQAPMNTDLPAQNTQPPMNAIQQSPTKYNYGEALGLSILFYDAQRSGRLPANNPIPWRGDSAVNDGDNGIDLSGGWYDAGDHVKFNLPMSSASTILLWGLEKWKDAYEAAGQLDMMYDMIRWPLEYFLKCWRPAQNEYYVQVGDGQTDHSYWGRPEDMHMWRPAYKVTPSRPGSDVAGETAASLAAGSIVFKTKDPAFSAKLVEAAKGLYKFARDYRGRYSDSVPQAKAYYGSNKVTDELCEGAAWLHKATGDNMYLNDAKSFYQPGVPWALNWGDKEIACQMLLYEITKEDKYKNDVSAFVRSYMPGGSVGYTPCGLVFANDWGSLRYAGNAAFVALLAVQNGIGGDDYKTWALSQIDYILGDNNRHMSYEIGFGSYYPTHPHHRSSSSSHALLKGGLVGGPDKNDHYEDRQDDYQKNEVACDYNAGFQSALAGLYFIIPLNLYKCFLTLKQKST